MLFIGGGALLARAVEFSKHAGLAVDVVCCPRRDSCTHLRKKGISVVEFDDPNIDLLSLVNACSDGIAFSINNRYLLQDRLLSSGLAFFNVHNGLIQEYRGVAEVCVFAAICLGSHRYGATVHRILPGQRVDSGPVVAQLEFYISYGASFSDVMSRSLVVCEKMFELNVPRISSGAYSLATVETSPHAYSYKDIPKICSEAEMSRLARARDLRQYSAHFPKLRTLIESASRSDSDRAGLPIS